MDKNFENQLKTAMDFFKKETMQMLLKNLNSLLSLITKMHTFITMRVFVMHISDKIPKQKFIIKKAIFIDDKLVETYINIADLYYKENRLWDAIEILLGAIALISDNAKH